MKVEHLREFLCLANEKSFSAAASKLFISQPALSKHVAAMEDELRTTLVVRSTNGISLTEEGVVAAECFALVVADYDASLKAISLKRSGCARKIRMAFLQHSLDGERFRMSERIRAIRPDYEVDVCFKDAEEIAEGLQGGSLDVALLLDVRFQGDEFMERQFVKKVPLIVAVRQGDSLCELDRVTLADLEGRCLILPRGSDAFAQDLTSVFARHGFQPPDFKYSSQKCTQIFTMCKERGVAIIVEMSKENFPDNVHWKYLDEPDTGVDMCWVYQKALEDADLRNFLRQAARVLLEEVQEGREDKDTAS